MNGIAAIVRGKASSLLTITGFGCFTAAAWTVAAGLGLAVAGVSCLVIEYLTQSTTNGRNNG